jgi:pimeloyl-ACP methyl ester carboxylesterase
MVETNGIHMHIAESGAGPLVVLCHGFPESWYSWRHQLHALAEAGFHAIAPNMRGYGRTDRPEQLDRYTLLQEHPFDTEVRTGNDCSRKRFCDRALALFGQSACW